MRNGIPTINNKMQEHDDGTCGWESWGDEFRGEQFSGVVSGS